MFELPGLNSTGDVARDLDTVRRYLVRLVPQLEMQLEEAKADRYGDAIAMRLNGMAEKKASGVAADGAAALADHILDKNNPHGVTLSQLGLSIDRITQRLTGENGTLIRIGGNRGAEIGTQTVRVTVLGENWDPGDALDTVDIDLGLWDQPFTALYQAVPALTRVTKGTAWLGQYTGWTRQHCGYVRVIRPHEEDEDPAEATVLDISMIGMGVYGYGG